MPGAYGAGFRSSVVLGLFVRTVQRCPDKQPPVYKESAAFAVTLSGDGREPWR
jgi:hypothetical protein